MKKSLKKGEKLFIFDFDGTIADTRALYYNSMGDQLERWGISRKRTEQLIDLGSTMEVMLSKIGLSMLARFIVKRKIMAKVKKSLLESKKCHDVSAITRLKTKKILVTNSLMEFVRPLIKKFKLSKQFLKFYGAENFGDKTKFIKDYIKQNEFDPKNVYYIGDRVADIKTAKKAGCNSIIVAGKCAWDDPRQLIRAQPDIIINDLGDLIELECCL